MAEAGAVYTRLYLDGNQYFGNLKLASSGMKDFAKDATKNINTVGRDFANLARSVIGITATFQTMKRVVSEGINFNKFVQEQTAAFSVMMKSVDDAKAKMNELYTFAVDSPLTFKETVSASKQLLAYGFSAETLVDNMKILGTVAKATGHSLEDISYVYGTLRTQGRAYSRDLMQFAMRGIPIYEELADVMKVPVASLKKMTEEGQVGFKQVEKAFKAMTSEGGRFAGMMEQYMDTLSGKISMISDVAQQSAGLISAGITTTITNSMDDLIELLRNSSGYFTNLGYDLGAITKVLVSLSKVVLTLLPYITTFLKIWVASKIMKSLTLLPSLILKFSGGLLNAAINVETLGASLLTLGTASSNIFSQMGTAVGMLGRQLLALATNPVFLSLAALGAGIAVYTRALQKDAQLKESSPKEYLAQQYSRNMISQAMAGRDSSLQYTVDDIQRIAAELKLSLVDVVSVLRPLGAISDSTAAQIKRLGESAEESALMVAQKQIIDQWQKEVQWFASLTGESSTKYVTTGSSGRTISDSNLAARDYIASFEEARATAKAALGTPLWTKEELEQSLGTEKTALIDALKAAVAAGIPLTKEFYTILRARIGDIDALLESSATATTKAIARDIWYVRELQVKASEDKLDDLQLSRDKELATAREKYDALELGAKGSAEAEKAYSDARLAIQEKFIQDSLALEREQNLKTYKKKSEGDSSWFEDQSISGTHTLQIAGAAIGVGFSESLGTGLRAIFTNFGDIMTGIGQTLLGQLSGTEVGTMVSGGNIIVALIEGLADFLLSIENVQAVLNPISTLFEGARDVLEPIINRSLSGLVSLLDELGEVVGDVLAPIFNNLGIMFQLIAGNLKTGLVPILKVVSQAFAWLSDYVIVPVGNLLIDGINGIIDVINAVLLWVNETLGTDVYLIERLDHLLTTAEAAALSLAEELESESLSATIAYLEEQLEDMINAQIESAQDLYEVGAITATEYAALVDEANAWAVDEDDALIATAALQLTTVEEIRDMLIALYALQEEEEDSSSTGTSSGESAAQAAAEAAAEAIGSALGWWDVGSTNIPSDQLGVVHTGEAIIPSTFAEGIRSGEMVLSGTDSTTTNSSPVYVSVTVEGSVQKESDLATSIAQNIYLQRKRGQLAVGV